MLKENWAKYGATAVWFSLFLAVVVVVAQGLWSLYETYRGDYERNQYRTILERREASESIASSCAVFDAPRSIVKQCLEEQLAAYQDRQGADYDLQAQRDMAFWAFWMVILGGVSLIVSSGGVWLVWQSLRHTREALINDRVMGQAQTRAYITISTFQTGIWLDRIKVEASFVNTGQTPARNIRFYIAWRSEEAGPFLDEWHPQEVTAAEGRGTLGAGLPMVGKIDTAKKIEDRDRSLSPEQIAAVREGNAEFWVYGIVEYEDVFHQLRKTRYRYYMHINGSEVSFSPCDGGNEET